ncbi:hypothetical protein V8B55DRAFT_1504003 [Mucor lusitanicus]
MNGDISEESSGYDLYAALVLSNMLDTEQDLIEKKEKEQQQQQEQEDASPTSSLEETNHDVIWVPADKHPEIAPNEFANFIKTHGANTPTRRASSLHRRKSILSQSLTSSSSSRYHHDDDHQDDEAELNRTLSEKKRIFLQKVMTENKQLKDTTLNTQVFDRNSTSNDDSRIIAPRSDRSLLRRSAFSARGRSRKTHGSLDDRQQAVKRRSVSQRKPSSSTVSGTLNDDMASLKSQSTARSWDKSEGISLFDQPVNMSEWIDLGSASLESDDSQRGILTRVHDAESQLRSQLDVASNDKMDENEHLQHPQQLDETKQENVAKDTESPPLTVQSPPPAKEMDHTVMEPQPIDAKLEIDDSASPPSAPPAAVAAPRHNKLETPKRPGIIRSETETNRIPTTVVVATKPEKRSSWLGGLFNDKKNGKSNGKKEPISTTVINNNTSSPLSGLASLFSRSLSMKSNLQSNTNSSPSSQAGKLKSKSKIHNTTTPTTPNNTINATHPNLNTNATTAINDTTKPSITTTITTPPTIITNNKKKRSSRLEIPPPSERTFFNSNRLPLHVERAIYRLSHMKLADPRRPLQQQVLISNLMFWYLSIQQNDFQRAAEQRIETESPPVPDTQQKKGGKMSRLIHSAKKRRNEVAQFVQAYPLSGTHHDISNSSSSASSISSTTSNNSTRPSLKQSNVQFSLPPIPSHHHTINVHGNDSDDEDDAEEEEEDDLPLSHYKS